MSVRPFARRLVALAALVLLAAAPAAVRAAEETPRPSPAPSGTAQPTATPAPTLAWRSIGPAVSGGRVATVAGTDLDPRLMYAGAAGGGVWKSTDAGATWAPVFDAQGTGSIGAIAISPKDARTVWVGTGEGWPRNDVLPGDGLYRSTDGAKTWTRAGLAGVSQIARIAIDPADPRRIAVAALGDPFRDTTERGVYVTTDGGATWTRSLYVDAVTGASDVALDPARPSRLYAGMWRFRRTAWHLTSGGGDADGLYVSDDFGAHWTHRTGAGLPPAPLGRIGLAVAPSDPARVYALIESSAGLLWRSDDRGAAWTMVSRNTLINERPFYYSRVAVDPHDRDHLLAFSVKMAESTNGGRSWHVSGKGLHGDHHDAWFSRDGQTVLEGNDGGIAISRDAAKTWSWVRGPAISQFYHVAVSRTAPGEAYVVCGGLQDNGAWCAPSIGSERGILGTQWARVAGGDGTYVIPEPARPHVVWSSAGGGDNGGELMRFDLLRGAATDVSPYLRNQNVVAPSRLRYRFNWETPIAIDPFDARVIYTAGDAVFRTADDGAHWTPISGDLSRDLAARQVLSGGPVTLDVTGAETFDTVLALAPSPRARGVLWAGTDDGRVQLTRDGGRSWRDVSPPGLDADARIPAIEASHAAPGRAYVVVDRHYAGDRAPEIDLTDDFGAHWRRIVDGLPADASVRAVREDPAAPALLYAATRRGVFWSENGGASWATIPGLPLPPTEVRDLVVQPDAGDLVAATHGRGMYVLDDLTPLRLHAAAVRSGAMLFPPRPGRPNARATTTTLTADAGQNPPPAAITFWQNAPARSAPVIEIVDANGAVVRRFAGTHDEEGTAVPNVPNAAGVNRVVWQLDRDAPTPWRRAPQWERGLDGGAPVPPGRYTVRLIRDGQTRTAPIAVLPDPRAASADAETRGDRFAASLIGTFDEIDRALNALDNVALQAPERAKGRPAGDPIAARAGEVAAEADRLAHLLSSHPVNDQDNDFLEDLLRERLMSLIGDLGPGDPPAAIVREGRAVQAETARALASYRAFVAGPLQAFDVALAQAGLRPLDLAAEPAPSKPDPNADEHARRGDTDRR